MAVLLAVDVNSVNSVLLRYEENFDIPDSSVSYPQSLCLYVVQIET